MLFFELLVCVFVYMRKEKKKTVVKRVIMVRRVQEKAVVVVIQIVVVRCVFWVCVWVGKSGWSKRLHLLFGRSGFGIPLWVYICYAD